jgi:hypothetical protein
VSQFEYLEAEECEMQWKIERTEEKEMVGGGYCCCAQQTGVHRMVGSNCLVAIYLPEEERTSICVHSTF